MKFRKLFFLSLGFACFTTMVACKYGKVKLPTLRSSLNKIKGHKKYQEYLKAIENESISASKEKKILEDINIIIENEKKEISSKINLLTDENKKKEYYDKLSETNTYSDLIVLDKKISSLNNENYIKKDEEKQNHLDHLNNDNKEYVFSKIPPLSSSTTLTNNGIVKNPKAIFNKKYFPKNVLLDDNTINKTIIKKYFDGELEKILKVVLSNSFDIDVLPKWFQNDEYNLNTDFDKIPDLVVWFKNSNNKFIKYVQKIVPSYVQDNELKIINNELILKKDISNFINKPFMDKNINFTLNLNKKANNDIPSIIEKNFVRINLDLNKLDSDYHPIKNVENLLYKASINNKNEIELKLKSSSDKHFTFNLNESSNDTFFIEKYSTVIDVSYYVYDGKDENFSITSKILNNSHFAKLSSNEEFYKNEKEGKRLDVSLNKNKIFENLRKRVFVVGGGTSTMIAKVKPSDPNDQRYYFITNRHVSNILKNRWANRHVLKKFLIFSADDNKVKNADKDISIDVEYNNFVFDFWESKEQTPRKQGNIKNKNYNNADISISIIDISPIMEKAKKENNIKIFNYLNEWKKIKPLKLSKKTKHLNSNDYVNLHLASFPLDDYAGFTGRRYREHIISKIRIVTINDQAREYEKYGFFRTFIQKDDSPKLKYDLISGASGSLVVDENNDMIALFMQNIGDDEYGFGLLSSQDYDYFGYETNNNQNSFKKHLETEIKNSPDKFEMIEF
ncbi:hypothetical protein [Mycoplasmopsis cynos]|uniref:hypothetical protein n=1 Tax=Mycoplasmopsis cynos TaxID=171284 RepID=UPI002AFE558B|nr:hypothetical protein [Mycoplasmopsis cynos]WQQ17657.1 hypothetical protein RRG56_03865 [Mycoplasmopsis cynos]